MRMPVVMSLQVKQWLWFVGLWSAGVLGLGLVAGALRLVFGLILK